MTEPSAKFVGAVDLIRRCGATRYEMRYTDETVKPIAWIAVAIFPKDRYECAAAFDPEQAVFRLCEQLVDGGQCIHCKRPSGFTEDSMTDVEMQLLVCWYYWNPIAGQFVRSCQRVDEGKGLKLV